MNSRDQIAGPDKMLVERYAAEFSISRELAQIIASRYPVYSEAKAYLFPDPGSLHDPGLLPDMERAADRIMRAVKENEGILVYCHDDVDGYTSGVMMFKTLRDMIRSQEQPLFLYPVVREKDGYILNPEVLNAFRARGARLVITADFGVSSAQNWEVARAQDMDLIVCDHHEVKADNFAMPVVDPKRPASSYPFRDLAGVGVTFKVAQYLYRLLLHLNTDEFFNVKKEFFPLAMLGTIADRVPLCEENRVLCRHGLDLSDIDVPWLRYFREQSEIDMSVVTGRIIPTISSAAYCDPGLGVNVFMGDMAYVRDTCTRLMNVTDERRQGVAAFFEDVISAARVEPHIVISVVPVVRQHYLGSVAGWLRDRYDRTAAVIGTKNGDCIGELRSRGLNLHDMLHSMGDLFSDFGGHQKAAGFTTDERHLDEVIDAICRYAADNTGKEETQHDEVPVFRLLQSNVAILRPLMPFGEGNPAPVLTDGTVIYTIDNNLNIIQKGVFSGEY